MAKIYYQEDCNLNLLKGKKLLSLVMVVKVMHMH